MDEIESNSKLKVNTVTFINEGHLRQQLIMDLVYIVIEGMNWLNIKLCILHVLATGDIQVLQICVVKKVHLLEYFTLHLRYISLTVIVTSSLLVYDIPVQYPLFF